MPSEFDEYGEPMPPDPVEDLGRHVLRVANARGYADVRAMAFGFLVMILGIAGLISCLDDCRRPPVVPALGTLAALWAVVYSARVRSSESRVLDAAATDPDVLVRALRIHIDASGCDLERQDLYNVATHAFRSIASLKPVSDDGGDVSEAITLREEAARDAFARGLTPQEFLQIEGLEDACAEQNVSTEGEETTED